MNKTWVTISQKNGKQKTKNHVKRCLTSLITREMWIRDIIMSPTPSRKLSIKKIRSGILSINTSKYQKILKIFEGAVSYLPNTESKFNSLCKNKHIHPISMQICFHY